MKNCEVVEKILQYHPNIPNYDGCDGYKAGDPEAECTGIVSALVPTVEVIRKTADLGCNLIITHEPSYYMTPDFPEWRGPFPNDVYEWSRQGLLSGVITTTFICTNRMAFLQVFSSIWIGNRIIRGSRIISLCTISASFPRLP